MNNVDSQVTVIYFRASPSCTCDFVTTGPLLQIFSEFFFYVMRNKTWDGARRINFLLQCISVIFLLIYENVWTLEIQYRQTELNMVI